MVVSLTQDFFALSVFLTGVTLLAYLVYTLSNRHAVRTTLAEVRTRRVQGKAARISGTTEPAGGGAGRAGTATLTREFELAAPNMEPGYQAVYWGRLGSIAAWFAVITLLASLVFRTVPALGQHVWLQSLLCSDVAGRPLAL